MIIETHPSTYKINLSTKRKSKGKIIQVIRKEKRQKKSIGLQHIYVFYKEKNITIVVFR